MYDGARGCGLFTPAHFISNAVAIVTLISLLSSRGNEGLIGASRVSVASKRGRSGGGRRGNDDSTCSSLSDSIDDQPYWLGDEEVERRARKKLKKREKELTYREKLKQVGRRLKAEARGKEYNEGEAVNSRLNYLSHYGVKQNAKNRQLNARLKHSALSKLVELGVSNIESLDVLNLVTIFDTIATKNPNWLLNAKPNQRHHFSRLVSKLERKVKQLSPQGIAKTLHAFATLQFHPPRKLTQALELRAMSGITKFQTKEVVDSMWSFAKLGCGNRIKLRRALEECATKPLNRTSNSEISRSIWALSVLKDSGSNASTPYSPSLADSPALPMLFEKARMALRSRGNRTWRAGDAAEIMEALERLEYVPDPRILRRIERRLVRTEGRNLGNSEEDTTLSHGLSGLKPEHHVTILRCLASLSHRMENSSIRAITGYSGSVLDRLRLEELGHLTYAHRQLHPQTRVDGRLPSEVTRRLRDIISQGRDTQITPLDASPSQGLRKAKVAKNMPKSVEVSLLSIEAAGAALRAYSCLDESHLTRLGAVQITQNLQKFIKSAPMDSVSPPQVGMILKSLSKLPKSALLPGLVPQLQHRLRQRVNVSSIRVLRETSDVLAKAREEGKPGWEYIDNSLTGAIHTHISVHAKRLTPHTAVAALETLCKLKATNTDTIRRVCSRVNSTLSALSLPEAVRLPALLGYLADTSVDPLFLRKINRSANLHKEALYKRALRNASTDEDVDDDAR